LSSALFIMLVTALIGGYLYGQESTELAGNHARAVMLAEEGIEVALNIRDDDFANLADGTHGLAISGNQWVTTGSQDVTDIFTRQLVISTIDAQRKTAMSQVTWQQNPQRSGVVAITTRLTNWMASLAASWTNAIGSASLGFAGTNDGLKIQVQGNYAYVIRSDGTTDFTIVNISNPAAPTIAGTLSMSGVPRNLFISGNYAYITNANNSGELFIVNITNPTAPAIVGIYNAPGTADANGVYVVGSNAYVVRVSSTSNEFLIINVGIPSTPFLLGSLNLASTGYEVVVSGNYAYVASGHNSQELQVINISLPSLPSLVGSLDLSATADATTISYVGTRVFVGQSTQLRNISIASPTVPTLSGSYAAGSANINDIALGFTNGGTYAFLATSVGSAEFQVVDVTTPTAMTLLASVDVAGASAMNGVAYQSTLDRAFGVSAGEPEFYVFAPQ